MGEVDACSNALMNQRGLYALHQPPLTPNEGWDGDLWDTTRILYIAKGGAS